jgi:hypothetical protein
MKYFTLANISAPKMSAIVYQWKHNLENPFIKRNFGVEENQDVETRPIIQAYSAKSLVICCCRPWRPIVL